MKKNLLLLILLIPSFIFSQSYWEKVADFAPGNRYAASAFSVNGKGYIVAGRANPLVKVYYKDLWEYDPISDSWSQKADLPGSPRDGAAAFSIGGKGYVGAGANENLISPHLKDFYEYNPLTNQWAQKNDFPGASRYLGISFSINGKGYFGTGHPGPKTDFWQYDPNMDNWIQKANFPGGPQQTMAYFTIGDKGYAGTGYNNGILNNNFYEYDPAVDNWTKKANFPGTIRYGASGFELNGNGYLGIGGTGSVFYNDFYMYTPITDTWSQSPSFTSNARYVAISFVIDDIAYIGTGGNNLDAYKDLWKFTSYPVGLNEIGPEGAVVSMYPNPAFNLINVDINGLSHESDYQVNIYDLKGSILICENINRNKFTLDISNLRSGTYLFEVASKTSKLYTNKLQIIK